MTLAPLEMAAWENSRLLKEFTVCFSHLLKVEPLFSRLCGRIGALSEWAPVGKPRWVSNKTTPSGFLTFFTSWFFWAPAHFLPPPLFFFLITVPLKHPVTSVQIELSSHWILFPIAKVYYWLKSVLTILAGVWLYLWHFWHHKIFFVYLHLNRIEFYSLIQSVPNKCYWKTFLGKCF